VSRSILAASALVAMGGVCSAGSAGDKSPTELSFRTMGFVVDQEFRAFSAAGKNRTAPVEEAAEPDKVGDQSSRLSDKKGTLPPSTGGKAPDSDSKQPHLMRAPSEKAKAEKPRRSSSAKAGPSKASTFPFGLYSRLYNYCT
jgi:hypothetical protein